MTTTIDPDATWRDLIDARIEAKREARGALKEAREAAEQAREALRRYRRLVRETTDPKGGGKMRRDAAGAVADTEDAAATIDGVRERLIARGPHTEGS